MSGEIPMPSAPTEEAVKLARDFIDHHNGERMRAYREEADAMKRDLARRVDALVEAKVREAVDVCWGPARVGTGMTRDEIVARVLNAPPPPPRCETCFGCGYIPGTFERPDCKACGGTGREVRRGE